MLHLAQVQKQIHSGEGVLRLLARQEAEYIWVVLAEDVFVPTSIALTLSKDLLVLVEISATGEVEHFQDATPWILDLVRTYLTPGITPTFLQQEAERAEQWRQSLTLQNQDLARRSLELEARREQIQALEENLKREQGEKRAGGAGEAGEAGGEREY
ncbi:MAG: hypothetical protein JOZ78_20830 [Chroococcidiopsidaceae cyanobacterium CP_BM_ER_R8_30]|nr:hypothetical protein [Chroococcidiopsidaceae cyanobacterium CP_BM_ER_R8_30]